MIPELHELELPAPLRATTTVWHSHPDTQLGLVLAGEVEIAFPQESHTLRSNDFYLIRYGHLHEIRQSADVSEYHGFVALADSSTYFTHAVVEVGKLDWMEAYSVILRQASSLVSRVAEIHEHWERGDLCNRFIAQCLLMRMLLELDWKDAILIRASVAERMPIWDLRIYRQAVHVVERTYHDSRLWVPAIARSCAVSRSTLDKVFRRRVGYGPKEFLQRYRMDRAKERLGIGEKFTLAKIAEQVGIPDVFTFSRVFKRIVGCSPSAFRQGTRRDHRIPRHPQVPGTSGPRRI